MASKGCEPGRRLNLGNGVTESKLLDAIRASGYPFQATAVDKACLALATAEYRIAYQDEWAYIDKDSDQVRTLDGFVDIDTRRSDSRFSPIASMLIECKQSDLPFVFFVRLSTPGYVPNLIGTPHKTIEIRSGKDFPGLYRMALEDVLGFQDTPLGDLETALSFSKTAWTKGGSLELHGESSYRDIVLPMLKAVDHVTDLYGVTMIPLVPSPKLLFPIVILRAPMVAVTVDEGEERLKELRAVRVVRVEPGSDNDFMNSTTRAFDVVHESYMEDYVQKVSQTIRVIRARLERLHITVTTGIGVNAPDPQNQPTHEAVVPHLTEEEFQAWIRQKRGEVEDKGPNIY